MEKRAFGFGSSHSLAVIIITIAVGVQDQPRDAPQTGTWVPDYKIIGNPTFTGAISSVSTLLFSFSGTPGFFSIIAEMCNPRQYTQAVLVCQSFVTAMFTVIGCVVYYYCGSYVASPALGSAGGTIKKICYGLALPGLVVTLTIVAHVMSLSENTIFKLANVHHRYRQNTYSSTSCKAPAI